jgi:hypothetical protein
MFCSFFPHGYLIYLSCSYVGVTVIFNRYGLKIVGELSSQLKQLLKDSVARYTSILYYPSTPPIH